MSCFYTKSILLFLVVNNNLLRLFVSSSSASTSAASAFAADLNKPSSYSTTTTTLTSTKALNPNLISTGLRNLGNTCYLNAQLQCAFHIPTVRNIVVEQQQQQQQIEEDQEEEEEDTIESTTTTTNYVSDSSDDDDDDEGDVVAEDETMLNPEQQPESTTVEEETPPEPESEALIAIRELFQSMIDASSTTASSSSSYPTIGSRQAVKPRMFCLRLGIPPMVQQDSQEFWKLLLPAINKERLSDLYKGCFEDYITALDGSGREKRREELFLDLSLDISSRSTLLDSIRSSFGEPELLSVEEGNGWRPEKGAEKVNAHKGSSLIAKGLPPILQFHLKRFNYDWNTDTTSKINNRLAFPVELDLSDVVNCKNTDNDDEEDSDSSSMTVYDLQSVVIHMGEYGVGHYYSYVRPDIRTDEWYRFNDDVVEKVSIKDVLDDAYGGRVIENVDRLVGGGNGNGNGNDSNKDGNGGGIGGFFGRIRRMLQNNSSRDSFGYGGRTSNAYVLQYARRADQSMLYPSIGQDSH